MSRNAFDAIEIEQTRYDALRDQAWLDRLSANTIPRRINDADRINWLAARVGYLEHADKHGVICVKQPQGKGYWPLEEGQDGVDPDGVGITLIDYIDAQIAAEQEPRNLPDQRIVPPISFTGHDHYHFDCDSIDGCLDAPQWIAAGSTIEVPADSLGGRLISTRMVMRP